MKREAPKHLQAPRMERSAEGQISPSVSRLPLYGDSRANRLGITGTLGEREKNFALRGLTHYRRFAQYCHPPSLPHPPTQLWRLRAGLGTGGDFRMGHIYRREGFNCKPFASAVCAPNILSSHRTFIFFQFQISTSRYTIRRDRKVSTGWKTARGASSDRSSTLRGSTVGCEYGIRKVFAGREAAVACAEVARRDRGADRDWNRSMWPSGLRICWTRRIG
jgi:hypothetical protein